jgi:serine/threonine-protein kinase
MAGESAQKIGRYEVVGKLTMGGMAEIFLGRLTGPRGFEKPVVIKRILSHLSSPTFSQMFLDEARIVADIRHPNVVQVFDFGEDRGQLFMVMEYLEGESVGGILRRLWTAGRTLRPAAAAMIAAGACAGLHAAHELRDRQGRPLKLVHRDVSPSNLFVTYDGHVKVLDFGVAKAHDTEKRTDTGQVRGKSSYMSPEQSLADPVDRRSDLFSLGIVLFEMATMRRLFQRENPLLVYRAICEEPIPSMSEAKSDVPKDLERIARRALERSRDARYATAQEMRHELLAAARKLTKAEPEELLAETMHELFAERISEKNLLRSGLELGKEFERLPESETDLGATIPSVAVRDGAKREAPAGVRWRSGAIVAAASFAAVAATAVALTRSSNGRVPETTGAAADSPVPPPEAAPAPTPSATPPVPPPDVALKTPSLPAETPRAKPAVRPRPKASAALPASAPAPSVSAFPAASAREAPGFRRFD